jgi:hypothetical protein
MLVVFFIIVALVIGYYAGKKINQPLPIAVDLQTFERMFDNLNGQADGAGSIVVQTTKQLTAASRGRMVFSAPAEAKKAEQEALTSAELNENSAKSVVENSEQTARSLEQQAQDVRKSGKVRAESMKRLAQGQRTRAAKLQGMQQYM